MLAVQQRLSCQRLGHPRRLNNRPFGRRMNDRHNWEPASASPEYLSAAGEAMVKHLAPAAGKHKPVWLNQGGWMFHYPWWQGNATASDKGKRVYAYLSKVPADQVLILELSADRGPTVLDLHYSPNGEPYRFDYWGKHWIWCLLHNYGQRPGVYGNLTQVATDPAASFAEQGSTMTGIGITPEGIDQNPVVSDTPTECRPHAVPATSSHAPVLTVSCGRSTI
jgi:alpha-N-acetylglucosaminidase